MANSTRPVVTQKLRPIATQKLEDDELFKSIGGQIDYNYTQWQRTVSANAAEDETNAKDLAIKSFMVAKQPEMCERHKSSSKVVSLKHKLSREAVKKLAAKRAEQKKILKFGIHAKKRTIEEYRIWREKLLDDNLKLKELIEGSDCAAHTDAKKLLRKYEKFQGSIAAVREQNLLDLATANRELEETRQRTEKELSTLSYQLKALDVELSAQRADLVFFSTYKEKEYSVKLLQIANLRKELEKVKISNKADIADVKCVVDCEAEKMRKEQTKCQRETNETVTEEIFLSVHPSLLETAVQNQIMREEIELNRVEVERLERRNTELENELKQLAKDCSPIERIRVQIFSEFFPTVKKCSPDSEVLLNITRQEWLPI